MTPPPRLALLLLRLLLPSRWREEIAGDLEEEWNATHRRARVRLWYLVVASIAVCWIDRVRTSVARGPSTPLRAGRSHPPSTGDSHM